MSRVSVPPPSPRRRRRRLRSARVALDGPCDGGDGRPDRDGGGPSSLRYYRSLYRYLLSEGFAHSDRVGSVERVRAGSVPPDSPAAAGGPPSEVAIVYISSILAFTAPHVDDGGDQVLIPRGRGIQIYGDVAGLLMGIHHFNNGDGRVVSEVGGLSDRCPVRFVTDFHDSESSQVHAVDVFSKQILYRPDRPPSALFGAWRSAVSVPLAILSGVYGIPQISPLSTSTELDDTSQYRYFTRLVPSDAGTARATVDYLRSRSPDLRHLGVIYVNDAYGSAFHQAIQEIAQAAEPESDRIRVRGAPFSYNKAILDVDEIDLAVEALAGTGYRTFFGVFYDEHYDVIMERCVRYGIAGPGYVWIVSDGLSESFLDGRTFEAGSPLAVASQGVGILKAEGGRESGGGGDGGGGGYDRFAAAWYGQGEEEVEYYNCVGQPATNSVGDASVYYEADPDFFSQRRLAPTAGSVFNYDSVMALGLAACDLLSDGGINRTESYFDGAELFDSIIKQEFDGASGRVVIDPGTTSRDPRSAFFVLYNADGRTEGGVTTFAVETVSHTTRGDAGGSNSSGGADIEWVNVEGREYVYSDGTTTFPPPIPPLIGFERNYLSPAVRGVGIALAGVIFATALFFAVWTHKNRRVRVVRASQPMFLQMICAGTVLMGATIISLSIDDAVAGQAACDAACMMSPWFFACGFVVSFSALFSKTWRINKIFHNPNYRRIKVTHRDVMLPFVVLMTLNTAVLAVWTAVSPLRWERTYRGGVDRFGRYLESVGTCSADSADWAPYVTVLLIIDFTVVVLANFQAYQARSITTEYSESHYIGIIMASILQACCIGLPIVVMVADQPAANFFVRTGIIFVTCMSMLGLMFVPKVYHMRAFRKAEAKKIRLREERAARNRRASESAAAQGFKSEYIRDALGPVGGGDADPGTDTHATPPMRVSSVELAGKASVRRVSDLGMEEPSVAGDGGGEGSGEGASGGMGNDSGHGSVGRSFQKRRVSFADASEHCGSLSNGANALGKVVEDGGHAGYNEGGGIGVDEEVAVIAPSKANASGHVPAKSSCKPVPLAEEMDDTRSAYSDFDRWPEDDSSSVASSGPGIEIMNHPKAESKEMTTLRTRVDQMKLEKLELYDRIHALGSMLMDRGVEAAELEALTGAGAGADDQISMSHRRLRDEVEVDSLPPRNRAAQEAAPRRRDVPRRMFRSVPVRLKNMALNKSTASAPQKA